MAVAIPELWGVLNVTPDSFSDGGWFLDPDAAIEHALDMVNQGADVIDVGAESTRPGAARVDAETELARLEPVVTELLRQSVRVSVDTMRAEVAEAALAWGVPIINDVSGGLADPLMHQVVADSDAQYVLMHWRGHSDQMDAHATYDDVVAEVCGELEGQLEAARRAGIADSRLIVDPGLGFAKTPEHNWQLVRGIEKVHALGFPVLIGASRKRFLGQLLPEGHEVTNRDGVSAALGVVLAGRGIAALRVHNLRAQRQALEVWRLSHEDVLNG